MPITSSTKRKEVVVDLDSLPVIPITDIRIHNFESPDSKTKAFVDITLAGVFVVKGFRVIDGIKGLFVAMPSLKGKDGEYHDTAFALSKPQRDAIISAIMAEAEK